MFWCVPVSSIYLCSYPTQVINKCMLHTPRDVFFCNVDYHRHVSYQTRLKSCKLEVDNLTLVTTGVHLVAVLT